MKYIQKHSLASQIVFWLITVSLIPLVFLIYNYFEFKSSLKESAISNLEFISQEKAYILESYYQRLIENSNSLAHILSTISKSNLSKNDTKDFLIEQIKLTEYKNMYLFDRNGKNIFNLMDRTISNIKNYNNLYNTFLKAISLKHPKVSQFEYFDPSDKYSAFIGNLVFKDSKIDSILILEINNNKLYDLVNNYTGLGDTGETVIGSLQSEKLIFLAPLRHKENAEFTEVKGNNRFLIPLYLAVNRKNGNAEAKDYRDVDIVASWRHLPSFDWGLVVKMDSSEAFKKLNNIENSLIFIFVLSILLIVFIIFIATKSIIEPIKNLINLTKKFSKGDLKARINLKSFNSEMTILADSFNNMANEIESNITALQEQARLLEEQKGEIEDLNESLEEKIAIKTAKIKEYIEVLDEYIITSTTDLDGVITDVSSAFCKISGYKKEELIGKNHNIVRHPDNPPELFENLWETIQSGQKWEGDIKNIRKDGSLYWVDVKIAPNFGSDGKLKSFTAIRTDITDKKIIEELSITDTLTKLYNRRHFNEVILKEIARNKRDDNYFSFLMMDIDHFKLYNDTYGHQAGDNVLSLIAKYLIDSLSRASDYAFRLGGEEFAIIFSGLNPKDAFEFADKIRFGIENLQIEHKKNSASSYVTTSMGLVTLKGNDIADEINLYNMADETLYLAKSQGRNRVVEK